MKGLLCNAALSGTKGVCEFDAILPCQVWSAMGKCCILDVLRNIHGYGNTQCARTPLVLGTSFPPVRVMAMRIARARALKADSALTSISAKTSKIIRIRTCGDCSPRG